jgi:hypothetical protein
MLRDGSEFYSSKKKKGVEEIQLKARRLILDKGVRGLVQLISSCPVPPPSHTIIVYYRLKTRSNV